MPFLLLFGVFSLAHSRLLVSEVATNYDGNSFVELFAPNGIDTNTNLHYGMTILSCKGYINKFGL